MSNKYFKTRTWTALLVALFVLFAAAGATAETWHVTDDFSTITDALAAASPGDTIEVSSTYDFTGERFPILVQKDDLTIKGLGGGAVLKTDTQSHAVFTVGAKREYNTSTDEYETVRVSGVTIENFTLRGEADIGFVIKHADNITLANNTVDTRFKGDDKTLQGFRLIDAKGSTLSGNKVMQIKDIGIFIEESENNNLLNNSVTSSGLGLFVFESSGNSVMGDSYMSNREGGVVLNDSSENTLADLEVADNNGWGVRFVYADKNTLENSKVWDNSWGGVELIASQENTVDANLVYNNGRPNDGNDDAQVVITKGEKAEFTSDILDDYNNLGDLSEFVEEKEQVKGKLETLEWWLDDLNMEMAHLRQRLATAIGMHEQNDPKDYINSYLHDVISEKLAIEEGKILKVFNTNGHLIDENTGHHVQFIRGSGMGDLSKNFTLENSTFPHRDKLDAYTDDGGKFNGEDFGLEYYSGSGTFDPSNLDITLIEVIDVSGSMSTSQFNLEIEGIRDAIDNVLRPLVAQGASIDIGFVQFATYASRIEIPGESGYLEELAVSDHNDEVDEMLDAVTHTTGFTNIEEALAKVDSILNVEGVTSGDVIVNLSSDGVPNKIWDGGYDSGGAEEQALAYASDMKAGNSGERKSGVSTQVDIWPVGVDMNEGTSAGDFMKALAGPSPAVASFADNFADYNEVVNNKTEMFVEPEDDYSWSKMDLIHILLNATKHEVWNDWNVPGYGMNTDNPGIDSLKEKVEYWHEKGLITDMDFNGGPHDGLKGKLDAVLGYLAQIREIAFKDGDMPDGVSNPNGIYLDDVSLRVKLRIIDHLIEEYIDSPEPEKQLLLDAKSWVEEFMEEKEEIYGLLEDIRMKLCLVDVELVPFPKVNTDLLGKKEKPFEAISDTEMSSMKQAIVDGLNINGAAQAVREAVKGSGEWKESDIRAIQRVVRHSENNMISSNVIFTELESENSKNIGIVVESPRNEFINNLITNEQVEPIFDETTYEESGRMDVGIILLSNENRFLHNAIEWVNTGMRRGGGWKRKDYQLEYDFYKMAEAAYWPAPGYAGRVEDFCEGISCGPFTEFDERTVDWVPVLEVEKKVLTNIGYGTDCGVRVFRNDIALNFFDHNGLDIDVVNAESNDIFMNLFYKSGTNAILIVDEEDCTDNFGIRTYENDFVHTSLKAEGDSSLNASDNYGEGTSVFGSVTPPSADSPFCEENFGNVEKFENLEIGKYFNGGTLPPNLDEFFVSEEEIAVVLPPEKPRTCADIFGDGEEEPPAEKTATTTFSPGAGAGFMMISYPLEAPDPTVDAIFDELTGQTLWNFWSNENPSAYVTRNGTGTISHNRGYWVYLSGDTEVTVEGSSVSGPANFTFPVPGWYMISTPFASDWASQSSTGLEDNGAGYARLVYFNEEAGQYVNRYSNDSFGISPWKGYWVKAVDAGATLTLPQVSVPSVPSGTSSSYSLPEGVDVDALDMPPAPPFAQQLDLDGLEVTAASVSDGVTFSVKGEEAAFASGLEVKVFSVSGGEVFSAQSAGSSLTWNAQGVSNGVYLYTATAYVNGKTVSTDIDKLLLVK